MDTFGNPLEGALVDIWQANKWGRYDHEDDRSRLPLDPNFQGWAQLMTGADGAYSITTIKPGPYPRGSRIRPPHIHFRVRKRGFRRASTQMYFKGEELNDKDHILNAVKPRDVRDLLVVDFRNGFGKFDLVLKPRKG